MDHFDAFCYAHVVTLDYEVHTPDETPGILADTDGWGAVDAKSVDSPVVSCDRQYHPITHNQGVPGSSPGEPTKAPHKPSLFGFECVKKCGCEGIKLSRKTGLFLFCQVFVRLGLLKNNSFQVVVFYG